MIQRLVDDYSVCYSSVISDSVIENLADRQLPECERFHCVYTNLSIFICSMKLQCKKIQANEVNRNAEGNYCSYYLLSS